MGRAVTLSLLIAVFALVAPPTAHAGDILDAPPADPDPAGHNLF